MWGLDRPDLPVLIRQLALTDPALAYALLETRRVYGPQPAQTREVRVELSAPADVPVRKQLRPQVCGDFVVTDFSHTIERPDTFAPGSLFREQSTYFLGKAPGIDVTIEKNGPYAYRYAVRNPLQAVTYRQAGDPQPQICGGCWIIRYCDMLTVEFSLRRVLAASESPLLVILVFKGIELVLALQEIEIAKAVAELGRRGYLEAEK